jgi:hypothetical protein
VELRLYDFTLLFDVVTITGLPAFITRSAGRSSSGYCAQMPKPATGFRDGGSDHHLQVGRAIAL